MGVLGGQARADPSGRVITSDLLLLPVSFSRFGPPGSAQTLRRSEAGMRPGPVSPTPHPHHGSQPCLDSQFPNASSPLRVSLVSFGASSCQGVGKNTGPDSQTQDQAPMASQPLTPTFPSVPPNVLHRVSVLASPFNPGGWCAWQGTVQNHCWDHRAITDK